MPRGRQYYNPLTQAPDTVQGETDYTRIELFPAGAESLARLPQEQGKWIGRRIAADGTVAEEAPGDFDHDTALAQATGLWPGLMVYELNAENEDSTWDGIGPSPRIWQNSIAMMGGGATQHAATSLPPAVILDRADEIRNFVPDHPEDTAIGTLIGQLREEDEQQVALHVLPIAEPGVYVLLDDICAWLEQSAVVAEVDKNPSAALALRDAVDALKEIG